MDTLAFNFDDKEILSGFRLHLVEVFNWGTFDKRIWSFTVDGKNGLMTGENGSGKTTMADAINTLLVPPRNMAYNQAGRAARGERTLMTYVRGAYKNDSNENGTPKATYLRGEGSLSVILAVFINDELQKNVTLFHVYTPNDEGVPDKLLAVSESRLDIKSILKPGINTISDLKRHLKANVPGTDVFDDNFKNYSIRSQHLLGISSDMAMRLFAKTVSMKTVESITQFVRDYMLDPSENIDRMVDDMILSFDSLERAYQEMIDTRRKIEILRPVSEMYERSSSLRAEEKAIRALIELLPHHSVDRRFGLLKSRMSDLGEQHARALVNRDKAKKDRDAAEALYTDLDLQIRQNDTGSRISAIEAELKRETENRKAKEVNFGQYEQLAKCLGLDAPNDAEAFDQNLGRLNTISQEIEESEKKLSDQKLDAGVKSNENKKALDGINNELRSLEDRRSSIPSEGIRMRDEICDGTGIDVAELPFAGELIQVNDSAWQGAIERVLNSFARSLIVPDKHYKAVNRFVNDHNMRGRIEYYMANKADPVYKMGNHQDSMLHKLDINEESGVANWLKKHLVERFDYVCCKDPEDIEHHNLALTITGLMKSGKRHIKDDRHGISDSRNYVLGWDNSRKVSELRAARDRIEDGQKHVRSILAKCETKIKALRDQLGAIAVLQRVRAFDEIDWKTPANKVIELQVQLDEIRKAVANDTELKTLETQREKAREAKETADERLMDLNTRLTNLISEQEKIEGQIEDYRAKVEAIDRAVLDSYAGQLQAEIDAVAEDKEMTLSNIDSIFNQCERQLSKKANEFANQCIDLDKKIINQIHRYGTEFERDRDEFGTSEESIPAYIGHFHDLEDRKLALVEDSFRAHFTKESHDRITGLSTAIYNENNAVKASIRKINDSLREIDYAPGHYIEMVFSNSTDFDIREFNSDLKAATENMLGVGANDLSNHETRYARIKPLIDKFKSDVPWRRKVTDVRQYLKFDVSEKLRDTNDEFDYYPDASGKSGGQKEKLAYTILAASLAHQYRMNEKQIAPRTFRLVMIDEAFASGSQDFVEYGMKLFTNMGFQILMITPLEKISAIEPYIERVGYFTNTPERNYSEVMNLGMEDLVKRLKSVGNGGVVGKSE